MYFLLVVLVYAVSCASSARTPNVSLQYAAMQGKVEAVRGALARGADVNEGNWAGYTPLHWAASKGHVETVRLLISHGANINAKTKMTGDTPLHLAAKEGQVEVIRLLIANNADINMRNHNGDNPLTSVSISWGRCKQTFDASYPSCRILERSVNTLRHFYRK